MQFSGDLSPYSNPANKKTTCPGLTLQSLPQTMDPRNMHTIGDETMSTPTEFQMNSMKGDPESTMVTPSPSPPDSFDSGSFTPYTPGSLSTAPSGYSSRRESMIQTDNPQTYSLPSLPCKWSATSSFEPTVQSLDPSVQSSWMGNELAIYSYNEDTAGLDMANSEQWNYNLPRKSDLQTQCPVSEVVAQDDSISGPAQQFELQQSEYALLLSSQANPWLDRLRQHAGLPIPAIPSPLDEAFEYRSPSASASPGSPANSFFQCANPPTHSRSYKSFQHRVSKPSQKHPIDHCRFTRPDRQSLDTKIDYEVIPKSHVYKQQKCLECGECFFRPEHLDRHKRIHDPKVPWLCPMCPKVIMDRHDNLTSHITNTHFTSSIKPSTKNSKMNARITMRAYYERYAPNPDRRDRWIKFFEKHIRSTNPQDISDTDLWRLQLSFYASFQKLLNNKMTVHDRPSAKKDKKQSDGKPDRAWTMIGWSIQEAQHVLVRDIDPDWKDDPSTDPSTTLYDVDPRRKAMAKGDLALEDRQYLDTDMLGTQAMGLEELDPAWIALKQGRLSPEQEELFGAPVHLRGLGGVGKGTKHKRESRL